MATGRQALDAASAAMNEALAAFDASQSTINSIFGRFLTTGEPVPIATTRALVTKWQEKARVADPLNVKLVNSLIVNAEEIIADIRQKIGISEQVTLSRAVDYVAKESLQDVADAADVTRKLIPWIAGLAVVVALVALFLRVRR